MIKEVVLLGSTGSIGSSTLKIISKKRKFKVTLLSASNNIHKLFKQSIKFKVKHAIICDNEKYNKFKSKFKKKKIKLHFGFQNIDKIIKKKVSYCINAITGIDGLDPTLKLIPLTDKILIANKESIICGWNLIYKKLLKYETKFIPIDSEHFSIWNLIKNQNINDVDKIILTASGGPFLKSPKKNILNIKPKFALKHPNWKMGKKISIDSSTMMNKIFEFIEAKKIFNLTNKKLDILIHPTSYVHAIVFFKGNIIKFLAHDTKMTIPIANALGIYDSTNEKNISKQIIKLKNINFEKPKLKQFPLLSIIDLIPNKYSYFETILTTINDNLVNKYLNNEINYISIHRNILKLIKSPFFKKYYNLKPKNIYDIKTMIDLTNNFLKNEIKSYDI